MTLIYEVQISMPTKPIDAMEITDLFFEYKGGGMMGDPKGKPNFVFEDKKNALGFLEKVVDLPYVEKASITPKRF